MLVNVRRRQGQSDHRSKWWSVTDFKAHRNINKGSCRDTDKETTQLNIMLFLEGLHMFVVGLDWMWQHLTLPSVESPELQWKNNKMCNFGTGVGWLDKYIVYQQLAEYCRVFFFKFLLFYFANLMLCLRRTSQSCCSAGGGTHTCVNISANAGG